MARCPKNSGRCLRERAPLARTGRGPQPKESRDRREIKQTILASLNLELTCEMRVYDCEGERDRPEQREMLHPASCRTAFHRRRGNSLQRGDRVLRHLEDCLPFPAGRRPSSHTHFSSRPMLTSELIAAGRIRAPYGPG
jgi:hypothetical protein